ncbi:MAG TPA: TfoX/Sxy family protein [Nitrospirota bacterium]|nr:TfoX/Sxy family protein [Nitrospirota bacterium]
MPYNTKLEEKIYAATQRWKDLGKKKMFGGICYLLRGNMCFGIWKDFLIVRMDREQAEKSLKLKNVRPFDITGSAMAGWVTVEEAGWRSAARLEKWLAIGKEFARTLPEKKSKTPKNKTLKEYQG